MAQVMEGEPIALRYKVGFYVAAWILAFATLMPLGYVASIWLFPIALPRLLLHRAFPFGVSTSSGLGPFFDPCRHFVSGTESAADCDSLRHPLWRVGLGTVPYLSFSNW